MEDLAKENVDPNLVASTTASGNVNDKKAISATKLPAIEVPASFPYVGSSPRKHSFAKATQASRIRNKSALLPKRQRDSPLRPEPLPPRKRAMQYYDANDLRGLPAMGSIFGQLPLTPLSGSLPSVGVQDQVSMSDRAEMEDQRQLITQLAQSNAKLFDYIEILEQRIRSLEVKTTSDQASFDIDAAENESNSGVYVPRESFDVSSPPATPSMRKGKKSFMTSTPKEKKAYTMLNKRKTHNLTSTLPPVFTQVPAVPLTDKEIVVYFFNSLSRPIVSIRLYERGWGPARICDTLNDHRAIEPPYLRNTCSVKCVTAIRRGLDKWGAEWDTQLRDLLKDADDAVATDAMRIQEDECDEILDIDVLDLLKGLVKYPDEEDDDGIGAGIFTKCVRYCAERQLSWPLSKIHTIALALQEGREPDIAEAHD